MKYRLTDYLHFARMYARNRQRQRVWGKLYEASVRSQTFKLPAATVVQLIPTEACNLRCPFCNQWGENGYFFDGVRRVEHMDEDSLIRLMRGLSPRDSMISVHGGEPFVYKHIDTLLELLREQQFDVIFTTNGTRLKSHLTPLAKVRNLMFLLSIDGDEKTHDKVRGKGTFKQARESMAELFELRRQLGLPLPVVIMTTVVCEWTTDVLETVYEVAARDFNAVAINYNFRWFLTEDIGQAYERHLQHEFGLKSSGAWRGWLSANHDKHDYGTVAAALTRVLENKKRFARPFVVTTPSQLRGQDYETYFTDYLNTFGNESCFMPFYWARVHASGELIFCPGHPDIIAGNVFRDGFMESFNSATAIKFRKHMLTNRLPICNRCCGLYMTNPARPFELKARKKLGLPQHVNAHWPETLP